MTAKRELIFKSIYEINRWLFYATGFGFPRHANKIQKILFTVLSVLCHTIFVLVVCLFFVEIGLVYKNVSVLFFTLGFTTPAVIGGMKVTFLESNDKDLKEAEIIFENNMNLPWLGQHRWEKEVKRKNENKIRIISKMFYFLGVFYVISISVVPLVGNSEYKFVLPFPYASLVHNELYPFLYVFQITLLFSFVVNFLSFDLICFGLLVRICENLEIIEFSLRKFCDSFASPDNSECFLRFESNIHDCLGGRQFFGSDLQREGCTILIRSIVHHQAILRQLKLIGNVYSYPIFLQLIFGSFVVGLLIFTFTSEINSAEMIVSQVCYVLVACSNLLTYCYLGTEILEKFNDVRFAVYSCPWYEMDIETRKLIAYVLLGLQKSGRLTAGKIVDVALTTYLSLGKMSYNCLALLQYAKNG